MQKRWGTLALSNGKRRNYLLMENTPKSNTKKYKISFLILLILAALTFHVIFKEFNFDEIIKEIADSSHKNYLFLAAASSIIYLMLYGRFMGIGIRAFKEKTSRLRCFIYGCADFFYSAITPSSSGGQPVVIYLMAKDGLSYSTSAITVILQTIAFKMVLLFYNLLSLFFIWDIIASTNIFFRILLIFGIIITIVSMQLCYASMYRTRFIEKCGRALIRFLTKIHIIKDENSKLDSFEKTILEYKEAAAYIKDKKHMLIRMIVVTFLQRTVMFAIAFFVYKSFGLNDFGFIEFLCLQALVSLAIDNVPLPGSMGANEYATYLLYGAVYGENNVMSAAAMLLTRGFAFYFPLIISSIFVLGKQALAYIKIRWVKIEKTPE